jgi:hemolysin activation/secretion protein
LLNLQSAVGTKTISMNSQLLPELYDGIPLRTTQYTFGLRAERYVPVKRAGVLLLRLRSEGLLNPRLFTNDLLRLGGLNTLRGFNENQFYASSFALATAEFRQFIGPDSYVFAFADQAYFRHSLEADRFDDHPVGLGAGLSFRTAAGMFQFVYSLGQAGSINQRFGLNASKIHFGLTSRF